MRLPKLRFSLRLMLVLVAIAAIALGGWVLVQRAREYRKRAAMYALEEQWAVLERESAKNTAAHDEKDLDRFTKMYNDAKRRKQFRLLLPFKLDETEASIEATLTKLIESTKSSIERYRARAASRAKDATHSGQLRRKYEYAARHPWLWVEPDPPPLHAIDRAPYWLARRDYGHALEDYAAIIQDDPEYTDAYNSRAWIWATCPDPKYRDGKRAVESATRACELDGWVSYPYLDTLAAAHAEAADFAAAVHWQQEALRLVPPNSPDRPGFKHRLSLYEEHKPYRDEPQPE